MAERERDRERNREKDREWQREREIDRAREREKETDRVSKVVVDLIPKTTLFTTTLYVSVLFLSHPLSLLLYIIHLSSFFNPLILIQSLTHSVNQSITD